MPTILLISRNSCWFRVEPTFAEALRFGLPAATAARPSAPRRPQSSPQRRAGLRSSGRRPAARGPTACLRQPVGRRAHGRSTGRSAAPRRSRLRSCGLSGHSPAHSLGGAKAAFARSRQVQSSDRGQRGQGCIAPEGLDLDASARRGRTMTGVLGMGTVATMIFPARFLVRRVRAVR